MQATDTVPTVSSKAPLYLRLQMAEQVGPIRLQSLVKHFGSVEAVCAASLSELQRVDGIGPVSAQAIVQSRRLGNEVDSEIATARECGVRLVCLEDSDYPAALRHIADPPICLYVRGTLEPADAIAVAIVGTRKCSHYGREQAQRFGELLSRAGFTVVSGLARGIDGFAHRGALSGGGRSIAVLGNGLGSIYPPEHEELAEQIAGQGALLSELPIDAAPEAKNFPGRNRIIAGLSLGTLVIEAGKRSGALITARLAIEYNREAFALPGNIDRADWSGGTNAIIRDGTAKLVTCLEDILDELGDVGRIMTPVAPAHATTGHPFNNSASPSAPAALSAAHKTVLDAVSAGADNIDSVCETTGLDAGLIAATLTHLQLTGHVRRLPGNRLEARVAST